MFGVCGFGHGGFWICEVRVFISVGFVGLVFVNGGFCQLVVCGHGVCRLGVWNLRVLLAYQYTF